MKVIQGFATPEELTILRDLSKTLAHMDGSRPGIYKFATVCGYGVGKSVPDALYQKLLTASGLTLPLCPLTPMRAYGIQQFISYAKDGWINAHKDWVDAGCNLYRVNVMVDSAAKGGELYVEGVEVKLNEGDAIVLRAELEEHEVKPVLEGSRMIFTVGFHHKEGKPS